MDAYLFTGLEETLNIVLNLELKSETQKTLFKKYNYIKFNFYYICLSNFDEFTKNYSVVGPKLKLKNNMLKCRFVRKNIHGKFSSFFGMC